MTGVIGGWISGYSHGTGPAQTELWSRSPAPSSAQGALAPCLRAVPSSPLTSALQPSAFPTAVPKHRASSSSLLFRSSGVPEPQGWGKIMWGAVGPISWALSRRFRWYLCPHPLPFPLSPQVLGLAPWSTGLPTGPMSLPVPRASTSCLRDLPFPTLVLLSRAEVTSEECSFLIPWRLAALGLQLGPRDGGSSMCVRCGYLCVCVCA